jgi:hypothetical protein
LKCLKIGPYNDGLQPFIFVVDDTNDHKDTVRLETDFATIGSGSYIASSTLFHRNQHWERDLMYTMYSVFEAKRFAEGVPGVGPTLLSMDVLAPGSIQSLSDAGYKYCEKLWSRFGPRPIRELHKGKFEMKEEFLEPFSTTGDPWSD